MCESLSQKSGTREIASQLIRAAASIGANLTEARGSGSRLEFARFFRIALKSSHETVYWLELVIDTGLASQASVQSLLDESLQINKMIGGAVLKLNTKSGKL